MSKNVKDTHMHDSLYEKLYFTKNSSIYSLTLNFENYALTSLSFVEFEIHEDVSEKLDSSKSIIIIF